MNCSDSQRAGGSGVLPLWSDLDACWSCGGAGKRHESAVMDGYRSRSRRGGLEAVTLRYVRVVPCWVCKGTGAAKSI